MEERKVWEKPELKVLPIEKTLNTTGPNMDGSIQGSVS